MAFTRQPRRPGRRKSDKPESDRRPCRLARPAAPQHAGAEPGKARRGDRPHLSAGAEIRARRQPHRRQPAARAEPGARRAGVVLLRRHGPGARAGDSRRVSPSRRPKRSRPTRCAGARRSSWSTPITRSTIRALRRRLFDLAKALAARAAGRRRRTAGVDAAADKIGLDGCARDIRQRRRAACAARARAGR